MKNNVSVDNPREVALKILYEIDVKNAYSNISLKQNLNNSSLKTLDRAFITQLVYGVIKNKARIDWIISKFSKTTIKKMSPWVLNILRLGIFQIVFLDKVPESAAVNECVKLGKKYGHKRITGFINAILRNIIRATEDELVPNKNDEATYLSIYYSHPKWMVEKWIRDFGVDFTIELLKKNNENPPITIRTNTLKISRKELMDLLLEEGLQVEEGQWCPEAILIRNISNIEDSKSFQRGLFQIQDQSSMLVAHVLNPLEEQLILDLCAAPGGKTTHLAQKMNNTGKIIARDVHEHKLSLMRGNIERLGISNIKLQLFNALDIDEKLIKKADGVVLDAPCSGLGIIRRKPDLKWNKKPDDIEAIKSLQLQMLEKAACYVKKHGTLIYSTCTINPEENLDIIKTFLNKNPSFKLIPIDFVSQKIQEHDEIAQGYLQVFPHIDEIDGFFISKMQRV